MNKFLIAFFLFFAFHAQSQLISGTVVDSGRKMTSTYNFKIKGKYQGFQYFELAVNNEGVVTSVKQQAKENSLVSTPAKLTAMKELDKLTFEKGTHFPKFQHVLVKVEFVK